MIKNKKRILHFHTSGLMATKFVLPLIQMENSEGYESIIITSSAASKSIDNLSIPFDLNIKNLIFLPFSFIRLLTTINNYRPDVIISHNFKSSLLPLLAAKCMHIKTRIYFNHGIPFVAYSGLKRIFLSLLERLNLYLATQVVTVSLGMKGILEGLKTKTPISLIAHGSACGLDLSMFNSKNFIKIEIQNKYGINDGDIVFTYIGRPEVRKGIQVMLRLWQKYFSNNQGYKLILCGPTQKDVVSVLGSIPDNIFSLGFVDNVNEILYITKYLILPSFHEGLSYAALEGMASGCVVIANAIDGNKDLIKHGENGYLIDNNDIHEYANLITTLEAESSEELIKIKINAITTSSLFSRDIFLQDYSNFLIKMLNMQTVKIFS